MSLCPCWSLSALLAEPKAPGGPSQRMRSRGRGCWCLPRRGPPATPPGITSTSGRGAAGLWLQVSHLVVKRRTQRLRTTALPGALCSSGTPQPRKGLSQRLPCHPSQPRRRQGHTECLRQTRLQLQPLRPRLKMNFPDTLLLPDQPPLAEKRCRQKLKCPVLSSVQLLEAQMPYT